MFSPKQETKIGESRIGVSVALALTRGSQVRSGMCVIDRSRYFAFAYLSSLSPSPPARYPFTLQHCHHSPWGR